MTEFLGFQMQLQSKKIILATGRYGGLFLNGLSKKLEIDYDNNNFEGELGIRIEMPYNIFNKINGLFNDIKIKKRIVKIKNGSVTFQELNPSSKDILYIKIK